MTSAVKPSFAKAAHFKGDEQAYQEAVWQAAPDLETAAARELVQGRGLNFDDVQSAAAWLKQHPQP